MKVTVVTAFPEFLDSFTRTSIVGRAVKKGLIGIEVADLRDFSQGSYRQIDDYSFGGKGGMTLMPEVLERALHAVRGEKMKVLFPTPAGAVLTQDLVEALSREEHLVIFCGHYEGLDERFVEKYVDLEYSIGDYVLTGGEIPAMTLIDALSRLVPGVVGKELSVTDDSFYNGMLDTPHFTRPAVWQGMEVPPTLISGSSAHIEKWRRRTAAIRTLSRRPDLLSRANVMDYLEDEVYIGLSVASSAPDLASDLAQAARTAEIYGAARVIAAPQTREDFDALRSRLSEVPEIKCVPSISRMAEWAARKKHGPLLIIAVGSPSGLPWMEAKRRLIEAQGPVLIFFGPMPPQDHAIAMRFQQETAGGELPRIALISATLDRFFGSR